MISRILIANPRGFCAGVNRALAIIETVLKKYSPPIYVNHDIVHNTRVVESLKKRGVIFSEQLKNIPEHSPFIFSAHGVSPHFQKQAEEKKLICIDATCPLVKNVHDAARKHATKRKHIFLIGHKNHPEVIGTRGVTPMNLVETLDDARALHPEHYAEKEIAVLTQTTLSLDDTREILLVMKKKFPELQKKSSDNICYATQNRQNAVKLLAKKCDLILIIGSPSSSNSNRLVDTAKREGATSLLAERFSEVPFEIFSNQKILGISSGASVPETQFNDFLRHTRHHFPDAEIREENIEGKENIFFATPKL